MKEKAKSITKEEKVKEKPKVIAKVEEKSPLKEKKEVN